MNIVKVGDTSYKVIKISGGQFDEDIQGHTHGDKSWELHYVYDGSGVFETLDKSFDLSKNTLYVNGPNIWHKQIIAKDNPLSEICIYIQLENGGDDIISHIFQSTNLYCGKGNHELKQLFFNVLELSKNNDIYSNEKIKCYIQLIITIIAELYSPNLVLTTNPTVDDKKFYIIEVSFLHDYSHITLEELSVSLSLSPRQTQRIIKEHYGKTFRQKKKEAQCDAALLMLQQGATINDVSTAVGYSDTPSFIRAFKSIYSKTPSEMLKSL